MSVRLSVGMERLAPTGRIIMKFDIWEFFPKSGEKIQVSLKSDKSKGYFTRRPMRTYNTYLTELFLEYDVSYKSYGEKQNTFYVQ